MDYDIRLVDFTDPTIQEKVAALQNIVYSERGGIFTTDGLRFWYIENPMGFVISFNAFYGEEIVAHYACIPVKMRIGDKIANGLLDMATVTHPNHRGKGLFKKLAKTTYDYAKEIGYEFVVGVANANSFPGYMKYFDFTFVAQLNVKWGWGEIKCPNKMFSQYWDANSLNWRLSKPKYSINGNYAYGRYGNYPFIKTLMGRFSDDLISKLKAPISKNLLRPFNLYVGLGADLSKGHYFDFPKFVHHSPFNLIFMDLQGNLPKVDKENIFFQLIDFDVA